MTDFFTALLLAVVIEGLLYAAFPDQMKRAMEVVLSSPSSQIRVIGLVAAGIALLVLFAYRAI